jgi:N-acetylmuramoyl-L-alanine amidase
VLKAPDVPSVLVELGYLSNREDETRLLGSEHRQAVGTALLRALDAYFAWADTLSRT